MAGWAGRQVAAGLAALVAAAGAPAAQAEDPDAAARARVELTVETCRRLVRHTPDPGVEYEPGVSVEGEAVAPAEVDGGVQLDLPETITIPIELDVLSDRRLGRETPEPGTPAGDDPDDVADDADLGDPLVGEAQIGTVKIDVATGRATFNGQPLRSEAQRRLAEKCQEILREAR